MIQPGVWVKSRLSRILFFNYITQSIYVLNSYIILMYTMTWSEYSQFD